MYVCIWLHFAVFKPAYFSAIVTHNPLGSRRYITYIIMSYVNINKLERAHRQKTVHFALQTATDK